jgi:hypothetical protein
MVDQPLACRVDGKELRNGHIVSRFTASRRDKFSLGLASEIGKPTVW